MNPVIRICYLVFNICILSYSQYLLRFLYILPLPLLFLLSSQTSHLWSFSFSFKSFRNASSEGAWLYTHSVLTCLTIFVVHAFSCKRCTLSIFPGWQLRSFKPLKIFSLVFQLQYSFWVVSPSLVFVFL